MVYHVFVFKSIPVIVPFADNEQDSFSDDSADHDEEIVPRPSSGTHQGSTTVKKAAKPKPIPRMEESDGSSSELHGTLLKVTEEIQAINKVMVTLTESVSNLTDNMDILSNAVASLIQRLSTDCTKNAMQGSSSTCQTTITAKPSVLVMEASSSKQAEASGSKQADDHHSTCAEKFILDNGINLLSLKATDIFKYALILMDALFTETEMSTCCFQKAERGASSSKTPLPPGRVKLLEECLETKFGKAAYAANCSIIRDKLNQKCRDKCNKAKKLSKPLTTGETEQHQLSEQ
eukprot:Em0011g576a